MTSKSSYYRDKKSISSFTHRNAGMGKIWHFMIRYAYIKSSGRFYFMGDIKGKK